MSEWIDLVTDDDGMVVWSGPRGSEVEWLASESGRRVVAGLRAQGIGVKAVAR